MLKYSCKGKKIRKLNLQNNHQNLFLNNYKDNQLQSFQYQH